MTTTTSIFVISNTIYHVDNRYLRTFAVVAAEFKATWEKKLRGRDDKIIQTTRKEFHLAGVYTTVCSILTRSRRETLHQDFLEQYAILEDKKRKITAAIAEAQEELIVCPLALRTHHYIL
ncbi:uncharacterized protein BJ212DRAFT_1346383 [Suillus subaureus]|uniref:Uncharacterized protein n=1 Tax=Suillus subaureus TaxID=48587 RepID=A0A9P7EEM0_9AGAM|nr:uncharacterized protein BJ212DRAFT_1346383 [Suillus subaureus]KAG1818623.1 hypothetical protein BJ212DRAFT_1346383 [Suillus subaureus]